MQLKFASLNTGPGMRQGQVTAYRENVALRRHGKKAPYAAPHGNCMPRGKNLGKVRDG
jgi:hypothetical protein